MRRRLPLLVVVIVSAMMAAIVWLAFIRNRELIVQAAVANVENSASQLQSSLTTSTRRLRRDVAGLADARALQSAVSPLADARATIAAGKFLDAERAKAPQIVAIGLWSADGKLVARSGDTSVARALGPSITETNGSMSNGDSVIFTPLARRGDSVVYSIVGTISGVDGSRQGYVVMSRLLGGNPSTPGLLSGLVGPAARVLLGNDDGSLWTNFTRPIPDVDIPADTAVHSYMTGDGEARIHSALRLPDAPWRVAVDLPRSWVTSTAGRFLADMLVMVLGLLAAGALIVWAATRRALRPLEEVTSAVTRMAHGENPGALRPVNDDELGELATAFNTMSRQVQESSMELHARADALGRAYAELQESESRYRVLLDHLPDGVIVHRDHQIVFANQVCASILGIAEAADLVGRSVIEFIDPANRAEVRQRVASVQDLGAPAPLTEITLRRPDMSRLIVEVTSVPLPVAGRNAVQTILRDVTERQQLEAQLRQSQKMDAVGRLAGGVAHDFNNILTVIDAHAEFALQPSEKEETRREDIQAIRKASHSAAQLTRQLLAFSRKQAADFRTIDLSHAVKGVTSMLQRLIGEEVDVRTNLSSQLWPVRADPTHIDQIIVNLSVNARDAMPNGGTLTISTTNQQLAEGERSASGEAIPAGDYVSLIVEDTGMGMSDEVRSKIFEPFFTTKQPGRGTGLGLATVYGIVKQSGGHIWLYSEPGHGTTFKILLPRYSGAKEASERRPSAEFRLPSMAAHVLLVEDQPAVRTALSRGLINAGFVVSAASNVEEARRLLGGPHSPIDLVVTDMVMPGATGADLARDSLVVERRLPVIIMSGYSEEFTNKEWEFPSNARFLEKPVSPTDLIRLIVELIGPPEHLPAH